MKILMLGWEYPPHISGGLGTACEGLTKGLARSGVDIHFIVPRLLGGERAEHMNILDSYLLAPARAGDLLEAVEAKRIHSIGISAFLKPYDRPETYRQAYDAWLLRRTLGVAAPGLPDWLENAGLSALLPSSISDIFSACRQPDTGAAQYGMDLFAEVDRFTRNVVHAATSLSFDLIHAHDWMTYAAGIALARLTGKPLVCHVHSLEYDRSGKSVNERIHRIEGAGLREADLVVPVSYYTAAIVQSQHGVPPEKIAVVHNGVYTKEIVQSHDLFKPAGSKMVLFLGRITYQKGPDYFVEAAAKVIAVMPDATFVMAGSGDMLPQLINRVAELGLSQHFFFTGFLKGQDVERILSMADLYVMPSVSEPFGITPLEALGQDVPVIISNQSGVSEVLNNVLKTDFWDVDRLAHLIIGVLKYPEVRDDIITMARGEVRQLHWLAAAEKMIHVYEQVLPH